MKWDTSNVSGVFRGHDKFKLQQINRLLYLYSAGMPGKEKTSDNRSDNRNPDNTEKSKRIGLKRKKIQIHSV